MSAGNVPPTDLLKYIPNDAAHADALCPGCGDLRDLLNSVLLHGRRGVGGGPIPRSLSFTLDDWEPAVHTRNLVLLQLFLDSRVLLEAGLRDADDINQGMDALDVHDDPGSELIAEHREGEGYPRKKRKERRTTKQCLKPAARLEGVTLFSRLLMICVEFNRTTCNV